PRGLRLRPAAGGAQARSAPGARADRGSRGGRLQLSRDRRRRHPLSARTAALALVALVAVEGAAQNPYDSVFVPSGVRQLFLDDYLLGDLYRVRRTVHQPARFDGNVVVAADRPWEGTSIQIRSAPCWDASAQVW